MTVRRSDAATFPFPPDHVAAAVRAALASRRPEYAYVDVDERTPGTQWTARVKPNVWPLNLSTRLDVSCVPAPDGSRVRVETTSQWYILGDVKDYYRGYVRDLLGSVSHCITAGT
jgi:hypothetical protein